jgi:hypothetical protein
MSTGKQRVSRIEVCPECETAGARVVYAQLRGPSGLVSSEELVEVHCRNAECPTRRRGWKPPPPPESEPEPDVEESNTDDDVDATAD